MPIVEDLYVGCNNIPFVLALKKLDGNPENISSCNVRKMLFKYKNRNSSGFIRNADFLTNGEDGKIVYLIQSADLLYEGPLEVEGYLEDGTRKMPTRKVSVYVGKPLSIAIRGAVSIELESITISSS